MNKIGIFLLLIVSLSFFNCSDFTDETRLMMQTRLLGTWEYVSFSDLAGKETPSEKVTLEFISNEEYIYKVNGVEIYERNYNVYYNVIEIGYTGYILKFTDTELVLYSQDSKVTRFYEKID